MATALLCAAAGSAAEAADFTSNEQIAIPGHGTAMPYYPSTVAASGLGPVTTKVALMLALSHPCFRDLDVLLVGPRGQKSIVMSDTGGCTHSPSSRTYKFDPPVGHEHDAPGLLADVDPPPGDGRYLPTERLDGPGDQETSDVFPGPAPGPPYDWSFAVFNGPDPNGTWSLYVRDDSSADDGTGTVTAWTLSIKVAQCGDGLDNDGDGKTDFPADPGCASAGDDDEADETGPPTSGLPLGGGGAGGPSSSVGTMTPSAGGGAGKTINGTRREDRLVGTPFNDVINCGPGDDVVIAGGGNDVINCGTGDDRIDAGPGADRVLAGLGNDRLTGGPGADRLSGGPGRDSISGGSGDDRLSGGRGRDRLNGNSGTDRLFGGSGDDVLLAGPGRDILVGGTGRDKTVQ